MHGACVAARRNFRGPPSFRLIAQERSMLPRELRAISFVISRNFTARISTFGIFILMGYPKVCSHSIRVL